MQPVPPLRLGSSLLNLAFGGATEDDTTNSISQHHAMATPHYPSNSIAHAASYARGLQASNIQNASSNDAYHNNVNNHQLHSNSKFSQSWHAGNSRTGQMSEQHHSQTYAQDDSGVHDLEISDPELFAAAVEEHARRLGIDIVSERHLLWIARESLIAPLPDDWLPGTASGSGEPYYYNVVTGESRWEHPLDDYFRQVFAEERKKKHVDSYYKTSDNEHFHSKDKKFSSNLVAWNQGENGQNAANDHQSVTNYQIRHNDYILQSNVNYDLRGHTADSHYDTYNIDVQGNIQKPSNISDKLDSHNISLQIENESLRIENTRLKETTTAYMSEKSKLDKLLQEMEGRCTAIFSKNKELMDKNEALSVQLQKLQYSKDEIEKQLSQSKAASNDMQQSIASINEVLEDKRTIEQELVNFRTKHDELQQINNSSNSQIQRLESEIKTLINTKRQVEEEKESTIKSVTMQLKQKDQEIQQFRQQLQNVESEYAKATETSRRSNEATGSELSSKIEAQANKIATQKNEISRLMANISALEVDNAKLINQQKEMNKFHESQINDIEKQHKSQVQNIEALSHDIQIMKTTKEHLEKELTSTKSLVSSMQAKMDNVDTMLEHARKAGMEEMKKSFEELLKNADVERERVLALYAEEVKARRLLHNQLMELQGNIRVFCRVRPIQPVERANNEASQAIYFPEDTTDHFTLELLIGDGKQIETGDNNLPNKKPVNFLGQQHKFEFDHVFQPISTQSQVFEEAKALITSALDGYNVCIFAYGQTGSGKTYTMEGSETDRGVNYRALQDLFQLRNHREATGNMECTMKLSMLEVYNETIVDLLDASRNGDDKGLEIRMGKDGVYVENLIEVAVTSEADVIELMQLGHQQRSVGSHDFNEHSSRSHSVLSITIETYHKLEQKRRASKLHLIDLAGSERVSKTSASGQRLKEAQNINRSLSALGDVISALGNHSKHIPYRNSKLTFLLQESLSGKSKVLMFVNVSPVQWCASETLCSLNFASRCRNVALGTIKSNPCTPR